MWLQRVSVSVSLIKIAYIAHSKKKLGIVIRALFASTLCRRVLQQRTCYVLQENHQYLILFSIHVYCLPDFTVSSQMSSTTSYSCLAIRTAVADVTEVQLRRVKQGTKDELSLLFPRTNHPHGVRNDSVLVCSGQFTVNLRHHTSGYKSPYQVFIKERKTLQVGK